MDIWELLRIIRRRWYVFVPLAILAVFGSAIVARTVAVEYTNDASLLLVNPEPAAVIEAEDAIEPYPFASVPPPEETTGNRWLSFSGSLNTAAQALQLSVTSQETRDAVGADGLSPLYSVTPDRKNPILILEASSPDPVVAQETLDRLIGIISQDLDNRQTDAGAPESTKIRAEILARDQAPEKATGARVRVQLLALALGLALAATVSVAADHLLPRRPAGAAASDPRPDERDGDGNGDEDASVEAEPTDVTAEEISERLVALFETSKATKQGFATWSAAAPNGDESVEAR